MKTKGTNGSEIHRLGNFENVDEKQFNRLYQICQPIIKKLSYGIDTRKYGVSRDILQSYFTDKFMYVYLKYREEYDEERLKFTLIKSLTQFRNKLLRAAYTQQGEFNSDLSSFEDLFEGGKEWEDDTEESEYKEELSRKFHEFMKAHLTGDEYLLFVTQLNPPPFLEERMKESHGRISVLALVEFFDLPKTIKSQDLISEMRQHIQEALSLASEELSQFSHKERETQESHDS